MIIFLSSTFFRNQNLSDTSTNIKIRQFAPFFLFHNKCGTLGMDGTCLGQGGERGGSEVHESTQHQYESCAYGQCQRRCHAHRTIAIVFETGAHFLTASETRSLITSTQVIGVIPTTTTDHSQIWRISVHLEVDILDDLATHCELYSSGVIGAVLLEHVG